MVSFASQPQQTPDKSVNYQRALTIAETTDPAEWTRIIRNSGASIWYKNEKNGIEITRQPLDLTDAPNMTTYGCKVNGIPLTRDEAKVIFEAFEARSNEVMK